MRILFLITRQFHILMQVKDLRRLGFDNKSIASKAGIPEFAVRRNLVQAKSFSMKELRAALEDGVRTEEDTKTGRMTGTAGRWHDNKKRNISMTVLMFLFHSDIPMQKAAAFAFCHMFIPD